jgi:hypothetical protein
MLVWDGATPIPRPEPSTRSPGATSRPRLFAIPYATGIHHAPLSAGGHLRPWAPAAILDSSAQRPLLVAYIGADRKGVNPDSTYWEVKQTVRPGPSRSHEQGGRA